MRDPRDELDERLARLPRHVVVPRDLWPEIARKIERRPRRREALAVAAVVAMVVISGALLWIAVHGVSAVDRSARQTAPAAQAAIKPASFDEPRDAAYLNTRAALERAFRERLALLDPETQAKIEASLAQIRAAHEQIREALAAEPANPVLEHLLDSMMHDEFELYDSVVEGTQPSMVRS